MPVRQCVSPLSPGIEGQRQAASAVAVTEPASRVASSRASRRISIARRAPWESSIALSATSRLTFGVGPARLAEQQAAATSRADSTITRARLSNHGQLLAVSPDLARHGWWILVTREQTTGGGEYEGLAASDHITLVQLAAVNGRWAVSLWLPQI
jgi:hypothetical protein